MPFLMRVRSYKRSLNSEKLPPVFGFFAFFYTDRSKIVRRKNQPAESASPKLLRDPIKGFVNEVPRSKVFRKELRSKINVLSSPDHLWQILLEYS
jgi:hypothetical protein